MIRLPFRDGGVPSPGIVKRTLSALKEHGTLALHCKAGLGRTGTMACLLLMQELAMTPAQAIAWVRMCRPGSVSGVQGTFLQRYYDHSSR